MYRMFKKVFYEKIMAIKKANKRLKNAEIDDDINSEYEPKRRRQIESSVSSTDTNPQGSSVSISQDVKVDITALTAERWTMPVKSEAASEKEAMDDYFKDLIF